MILRQRQGGLDAGQPVWAQNYQLGGKMAAWCGSERSRPVSYKMKVQRLVWRWHVDHLLLGEEMAGDNLKPDPLISKMICQCLYS